jgi:hypothetical protein
VARVGRGLVRSGGGYVDHLRDGGEFFDSESG